MPGAILFAALLGCSGIYRQIGGPWKELPAEVYADGELSPAARQLVNSAFEDFSGGAVMADYHVHYFGMGVPDPYIYNADLQQLPDSERPSINEETLTQGQPFLRKHLTRGVLLATAAAAPETVDDDWSERLVDLVANYGAPKHAENPAASPHRTEFHVMAMDGEYGGDGKLLESSATVVSNRFAIELTNLLNEKLDERGGFTRNRFVTVGSVNPERPDWREQLALLHARGVRWIKWRVGTMNFDPARVSGSFYQALRTKGIGILTHTGTSASVKLSAELNDQAAPMRMTRALDFGVTVVMLHMGRIGTGEKPDIYFDQFSKMIGDPNYDGLLFGEISAIPYMGTERHLTRVAQFEPGRVVNGSDYPAVTPYLLARRSLRQLVKSGFIDKQEFEPLDEILRYNPLLFDFVLKRSLEINGRRLPAGFFLKIE